VGLRKVNEGIVFPIIDGFVKSGLFRRGGIFAESNSKKHPHCHFERQREIFNQSRFLVTFAPRNDNSESI